MNEELKIIINAVTANAKKGIQGVKKELGGMEKQGKGSGKALSGSFKAIGIAAAAVVGTIVALTTALVALANKTKQFREEQAKLNTAFLAAGGSTAQAQETYKDLYRFLGDSGKATEAAGHLAKLTTNEKELAEWTTALQGVYATFGDSLPIEGLTEAANETAKVGKVTGTMADALNWAGISEDSFNASLAALNSEAEREELIRNTLNGTYSEAALLYEKNNAEIIAANEAQARLDATTARLGKTVQPLQTALTNLSNELLVALTPAITAVANALTWLIDKVTQAVKWIAAFFGIVSGKDSIAESLGNAATGAGNLNSNLGSAAGAAAKLKKQTAGFDELNVMQSASSGSAGAGAAGGGIGAIGGGTTIDTSGIDKTVEKTGKKFEDFVNKLKGLWEGLKAYFEPLTTAISDMFTKLGDTWNENSWRIGDGLNTLMGGFSNLGSYLIDELFPSLITSISENLMPMFGDLNAFLLEEHLKAWQDTANGISVAINDILIPALEFLQTVTEGILNGIGTMWENHGTSLMTQFSGFTDSIREIVENLWNEILKPIWDEVMRYLNEIWVEYLEPLWLKITDFIGSITDLVLRLWNYVLAPVVNWLITVLSPIIINVVNTVLAYVKTFMQFVSGVIGSVLDILTGLIKFLTGVFSGDWEKAWEGIKQFFSGIWDGIWSVVRFTCNLIIDGLNAIWSAVYSVVAGIVNGIGDIAGAIGDLLGQDWNFKMPKKPPLIPKLATGGIVNSATIAMIGERGKEAVLPLENNTQWMDKLADKIAGRNGSGAPSKIVLMLNEKELGWASINSINSITQQTGTLALNMY